MKNILCFGFHNFGFYINNISNSPHSESKEDKKIFDEIYKFIDAKFHLHTYTAPWADYQTSDRLKVYNLREVYRNTGDYIKSLSRDDLAKFSRVEAVSLEMFERFRFRSTFAKMGVTNDMNWLPYKQQAVRAKLAYWNDFIEKEKIDFYFNSNVPHLLDDYIAYEICRLKRIPAYFAYRLPIIPGVFSRLYFPASIENHRVVFAPDGRWRDIGDLYTQALEEQLDKLPFDVSVLFEEVTLNGKTPGAIAVPRSKPVQRQSIPHKSYTVAIRPLQRAFRWGRFVGQLINPLTRERTLKAFSQSRYGQRIRPRRLEVVEVELIHHSQSAMPSGDFLYLPLHLQPEASSCPLGGAFSQQLSLVRFIAQHLPKGWSLAVKEHPLQNLQFRSKGWYQAIAETPGVVLVSRDLSTDSLTSASRAVCTLTGTAALEAWLHLKPALVFGDILFDSAPGIYKIRTDEDMQRATGALEEGITHSLAEVKVFLAALGKASFPGYLESYTNPNMNNDWLNAEKNMLQVSEQIIKLINFHLSEKISVTNNPTQHESN